MLASLLILVTLPLTHCCSIKPLSYYGPVKAVFWAFVTNFILLTASGSWPVVVPFRRVAACLALFYFSFFALLGPLRYFWDCVVL